MIPSSRVARPCPPNRPSPFPAPAALAGPVACDARGRTVSHVEHVLWIGGPPRSGKTTVARRLAQRYGLRLYSADTMTWAHRDRALAAGSAPARRWESLSPAERWEQPTDQLLEMSLHAERGLMILDDLRSLPHAPLIIAEGSTLPPSVISSGIADRADALWLLPTAEFQGAQLAATDTPEAQARLYRLLRRIAEHDVREHGVPSITVDGSVAAVGVARLVEAHFLVKLGEGPRAETMSDRRALLREVNAAIVAQVRGYYRRPWATGDPDVVEQLFVCECGKLTCDADVAAAVDDAAARPVLAPRHS